MKEISLDCSAAIAKGEGEGWGERENERDSERRRTEESEVKRKIDRGTGRRGKDILFGRRKRRESEREKER